MFLAKGVDLVNLVINIAKKSIFIFALTLLFVGQFTSVSFANEQKVETVSVIVVDISNNADQTVLNRMNSSMQVVAEQIIAGKTLSYVENNKLSYQNILLDISDRVFAGYSTNKVVIKESTETVIEIFVVPWQGVTKEVKVNLYLSGIDDFWSDLLREDIKELNQEIEKILTGVSVDAVDWVGSLVKERVRKEVADKLPFFKANVDVIADNVVVVDVILIPIGNSVKGVNYELKSDTMPSLVLLDARKSLGNSIGKIRGLPVDFLIKHKSEVEKILTEEAKKEKIVKDFALNVNVEIIPKVDSDVTIQMDSKRYRFWIEGYVDLGRDDNNISGRAHMGRFISSKEEIFLEVLLLTENMSWQFDPGISRRWGNLNTSLIYRVPEDQMILRFEYDFLKKWRFRVEKYNHMSRPEFALRYKIHQFLSAEIVFGADKENYFRIVGNL